MSQESSSYSAYSKWKTKKSKFLYFVCQKCIYKNFTVFQAFFVNGDCSSYRQFLADCIHILKGLSIYYHNCTFQRGVQGTFSKIGLKVQKRRGLSGGYDLLPLDKLFYIINLVTPPNFLTDFLNLLCLLTVAQFQVNLHLKIA